MTNLQGHIRIYQKYKLWVFQSLLQVSLLLPRLASQFVERQPKRLFTPKFQNVAATIAIALAT